MILRSTIQGSWGGDVFGPGNKRVKARLLHFMIERNPNSN